MEKATALRIVARTPQPGQVEQGAPLNATLAGGLSCLQRCLVIGAGMLEPAQGLVSEATFAVLNSKAHAAVDNVPTDLT